MAWTRIQLTEDEQRIVNEERTSHPNLQVRDKMLDDLALALRLDSPEGCRDRWGLAPQCSDMWMPTAKADWTDYGVRTSKGP